jgi:hypothetical protein
MRVVESETLTGRTVHPHPNHEEEFRELVVARALPEDAAPAASGGGGGRPHKKHPGLALREAARMMTNGETNKAAIARSATAKARERIETEVMAENKWQSGFTDRDDVDPLRAAIESGLIAWTPKGLLIRETTQGVFRDADDFEWFVIPQPQ